MQYWTWYISNLCIILPAFPSYAGSDEENRHEQQRRVPLDKCAFEWAFNLTNGSNVQKDDGITRIANQLGCHRRDIAVAVKALLRSEGIRWGQPTSDQVLPSQLHRAEPWKRKLC